MFFFWQNKKKFIGIKSNNYHFLINRFILIDLFVIERMKPREQKKREIIRVCLYIFFFKIRLPKKSLWKDKLRIYFRLRQNRRWIKRKYRNFVLSGYFASLWYLINVLVYYYYVKEKKRKVSKIVKIKQIKAKEWWKVSNKKGRKLKLKKEKENISPGYMMQYAMVGDDGDVRVLNEKLIDARLLYTCNMNILDHDNTRSGRFTIWRRWARERLRQEVDRSWSRAPRACMWTERFRPRDEARTAKLI